MKHKILLFTAMTAAFGVSAASAAVLVTGFSSITETEYSGDQSATDLVNQGESTFSSVAYSDNPLFGGSAATGGANNDGGHGPGSGDTGDITFWLGTGTRTITYDFDVSTNSDGYDITSIQSIFAWDANSGNLKNQNYVVEVSTVDGGAAFSSIASVAFNPFGAGNISASSKVNVTEDATGILASGVDQIRFILTIAANNQGPAIREIDVFGVATVPEPASAAALLGVVSLGLILRRRRRI